MNCKTYKNQILLEASGELNAKETDALQNHIKSCSECRNFAATMNIVTQSYCSIESDIAPHPSVMVNISQAAEKNLKKHELLWFPTHIVRLTAYAATLMFVAGAMYLTITPPSQPYPSEIYSESNEAARISELSAMVALVSDQTEADSEEGYITEESDSLEEFAQQLLEMQGFAVDDMFDDEAMLNLFAVPDPTTTQYHNTRGLPAKKCV